MRSAMHADGQPTGSMTGTYVTVAAPFDGVAAKLPVKVVGKADSQGLHTKT